MAQDEIIAFKIEGPIFAENFPLHIMLSILSDFHSILDQSYLVLTNKNRMSKYERLNFRVIASFPQKGSFLQYLQPIYQIAEPLLPLIPQLNGFEIWKAAKTSFEFLKLITNLKKDGKEYTVSAPNNQGIIIINSPGSTPIPVTQNNFYIADRSLEFYQSMSNKIEDNKVQRISAIDSVQEGIILSIEEKRLFNPETTIDDVPITIEGRVFDFNTERLTGKIRVYLDQPIKPGDYNFYIIGQQNIIPYIIAMTKESILLTCLKEVIKHATGAELINK